MFVQVQDSTLGNVPSGAVGVGGTYYANTMSHTQNGVILRNAWAQTKSLFGLDGLFLKGEADMVLSYTTSPAYHAIAENKPNYGYADFTEGFYPQIEVAGILKSSPHQDLAKQFLAWLATPEAQAGIPTTNWMYPVVALGDKLPSAFPPLPQKILTLPEDDVTADKSAWIDEALAALR